MAEMWLSAAIKNPVAALMSLLECYFQIKLRSWLYFCIFEVTLLKPTVFIVNLTSSHVIDW